MTKVLQLTGVLILGTIAAAALALLVFNIGYAGQVFPRVYLGQTPLGGLTEEQLKQTVVNLAKEIDSQSIKLLVNDQLIELKPAEINLTVNQAAVVKLALAVGRKASILATLTEQARLLITPKNISSSLNFDEAALTKILADRLQSFEAQPVNAELTLDDGKLIVKPAQNGQTIDQGIVKNKVKSAIDRLNFKQPIPVSIISRQPAVTTESLTSAWPIAQQKIGQPIVLTWQDKKFELTTKDLLAWIKVEPKGARLSVEVNQAAIAQSVEGVAKKINRTAKDARLKLTDGKVEVFEPSSVGYQLDQAQTIKLITATLAGQGDRTINLSVQEKPPSITTAQINDLGINELIGKATTSFAGSPDNRKHNIGNGARILNGILIPPDGEFSTLAALGQIDDIAGFLPELVIKENRTIPEFGGGLCQVSTTLFRAALNSGLPITERRNHSWRIAYYERGVGPGLDATVYAPAPDLKFKNDHPGWILIQGSVKGNEISFGFYGTKDGRRVMIEGPKLLSSTKPPSPVYLETADLPKGETKQVEKPHPGGATTATYIVYHGDGSERHRQVFRSSYKAVPARFLVGTGEVSPPEPEPPLTDQPLTDQPPVQGASQPSQEPSSPTPPTSP